MIPGRDQVNMREMTKLFSVLFRYAISHDVGMPVYTLSIFG